MSNAISGQTSNDIVRQQVRPSLSWFHVSGLKEQYKPYIFWKFAVSGFSSSKMMQKHFYLCFTKTILTLMQMIVKENIRHWRSNTVSWCPSQWLTSVAQKYITRLKVVTNDQGKLIFPKANDEKWLVGAFKSLLPISCPKKIDVRFACR
jgi:hypothetical protein